MPDLRPGQYKRIGRISEKNPERAIRVADRMEKRASRTERGKNIADRNNPKFSSNLEQFVRAEAKQRQAPRVDETRKPLTKPMPKATSRDTPLAPTPEPLFSR
jgi:hypothetical protein